MSEKTQALPDAALTLDPGERRWLAEALWDSFDEDKGIPAIAEQRREDLQANPGAWVSHEEVMKSLRR